jgi:hypothetical protein
MHNRLGDLRANAADNAVGTHQPSSRYRFDQMLRDQSIDGWNAGDIDDGDLSARFDNVIEQVFHDGLGAFAGRFGSGAFGCAPGLLDGCCKRDAETSPRHAGGTGETLSRSSDGGAAVGGNRIAV